MKSWTTYEPILSSVFCFIVPSSFGGNNSGLTGVSQISSNTSFNPSWCSAYDSKIPLTNVFGIDALTPYILIWSPLYAHQPKASSDKSPVPTTKLPILFDTSIRIWVLSLACTFSNVTSNLDLSYPISL